ncbi:MAG: DUF695 domain-containing protein [Alphaproteobacteria bacterium]|nr:DUF695 domain-containing protein [Alphaproteobacteria bacterium]
MTGDGGVEDWGAYFSGINGKPAFVVADLALRDQARFADHPRLLYAQVAMRNPDSSGLASHEEETLFVMEDAMIAALTREAKAIYAGKVSSDGQVSYFFYGAPENSPGRAPSGRQKEKEVEPLCAQLDQVMKAFPAYRYDRYEFDEPGWDGYLNVLYPSEWEMQTLQNLRLLETLHRQGDQVDVVREIDHFMYCNTLEIQREIMHQGEALGFRVSARDREGPDGRYGVSLSKDGVPGDIDDIVWPLLELARNLGAEYDGWGAAVVS